MEEGREGKVLPPTMNDTLFSRDFWRASAERAVKTFAQAFAAFVLASGVSDIIALDWLEAAGAAALAAMLSILTSIASSGSGGDPSPSLHSYERLSQNQESGAIRPDEDSA